MIPFGICDYKSKSYVTIDKVFYKIRVDDLNIEKGDIVFFISNGHRIDNTDYLKKNITFNANEYTYKKLINFRKILIERIEQLSGDSAAIIKRVLFNDYEDLDDDIGRGIFLYAVIQFFIRKKSIKCLIIFVLSFVFGGNVRYLLIYLDSFISRLDFNRSEKTGLTLLMLLIINPYLVYNTSIQFVLIMKFMNSLESDLSVYSKLIIVELLLFYEADLITILLHKYIIIYKLSLYVISLLSLLIPQLSYTLTILTGIYNFIFEYLSIPIRGSLSILGLMLVLLLTWIVSNRALNILILLFVILTPINYPFASVSFIDVGQGDSTLIRLPLNRANILIDTGSRFNYQKLSKFLKKKGIYSIDYLILTHEDEDHSGNIKNLIRDFNIKNLIISAQDIVIDDFVIKNYYLGSFDNSNDNSLVYSLSIDGYDFLFTGDLPSDKERLLVNRFGSLDIEVFKAGHHGSYTSNSNYLISNILPEYAIISTNGLYGHPHKSVVDIFNRYKVNVLTTKDAGDIEFIFTALFDFIKTSNEFVIINT